MGTLTSTGEGWYLGIVCPKMGMWEGPEPSTSRRVAESTENGDGFGV